MAKTIYQHKIKDSFGKEYTQIISFERKVSPSGEPSIYITIQSPGKRDKWCGLMTAEHASLYHRQLENWEKKGENSVLGVPFAEVAGFEPAFIAELERHDFYTVEQFSNATSSQFPQSPELRAMQERCKEIVRMKKDRSILDELESSKAALSEEVSELRKEIAHLRELTGASQEAQVSNNKAKSKAKTKS